jgi:signal transduction histidine kinase
LPPHIEIVVFRIVQEALTNVTRHPSPVTPKMRHQKCVCSWTKTAAGFRSRIPVPDLTPPPS